MIVTSFKVMSRVDALLLFLVTLLQIWSSCMFLCSCLVGFILILASKHHQYSPRLYLILLQ